MKPILRAVLSLPTLACGMDKSVQRRQLVLILLRCIVTTMDGLIHRHWYQKMPASRVEKSMVGSKKVFYLLNKVSGYLQTLKSP